MSDLAHRQRLDPVALDDLAGCRVHHRLMGQARRAAGSTRSWRRVIHADRIQPAALDVGATMSTAGR